MTELLERAMIKLQALPEREQDVIASIILDEIEDERRWDETFSRSPNLLAKLAASAMAEYHAGQSRAKTSGKSRHSDGVHSGLLTH
jgi:hypothetical protein